MTLNAFTCFGILLVASTGFGMGANMAITLENIPAAADLVMIAIDGGSLLTPMIVSATPRTDGPTTVSITVPELTDSRVRAIALKHRGTSVFPLILAVAAQSLTGGVRAVGLNFATQLISIGIGKFIDLGDGTVAIPAVFSGGGKYFLQGQVANLWVSAARVAEIGAGIPYLAPLVQVSEAGTFSATFKVPRALAGGFLQVGYHALDFRNSVEIPLLMMATSVQQSLSPPVSGAATNSNSVPNAQPPGPSEMPLTRPPGVYGIVVGPDGRLVSRRK